MNVRTRPSSILALVLAAGIAACLGGCVVSIGNERHDYDSPAHGHRVRLSHAELQSLPRLDSTSDLPTVRRRYEGRLAALSPSTTVEQFRGSFPEATFAERRVRDGVTFDAYALRVEEKFRYRAHDYGYLAKDEKWLYFREGQFVKFGDANQWP